MNKEALIEQATTGRYISHGNIHEGDCVVGFSFGYQEVKGEIKPGLSNEDLANFIKKYLPVFPLILQFEIASALMDKNVFKISEHRRKGEYLDTAEVARQALGIIRSNDWANPIIIAHPFHLPRADAVCRKLGINTIVPAGLEIIRFDPNSSQEWTRSQESWGKREVEAIEISLEQGLI